MRMLGLGVGLCFSQRRWYLGPQEPQPGSVLVPASAGVNNNAVGVIAWTNPGNIINNDATYASINTSVAGTQQTNYHQTTFTPTEPLPEDVTIDGLLFEVQCNGTGSAGGNVKHKIVRAVLDGVISNTELCTPGNVWVTLDINVFEAFGGESNLCGLTITAADINAGKLGLVISCDMTRGSFGAVNAQIDQVQVTVYYH